MPAGCQDASYDARFKKMDWQDFYANQGGFLFFEDLKIQWKESIQPDYVLIDSRTGHTDIGGICTRQMPDCVVAMFYPNEQNLRGLKPIVEDIRREKEGPTRKAITLHFVMANVPDLDDEDNIFAEASKAAKQTLGYSDLATTIYHYNSFTMLEQGIFTIDRPKSKLSNEYRQLTSAIVLKNVEDKDGALAFVENIFSSLTSNNDSPAVLAAEEPLQIIMAKHSSDIDVLRWVAKIRRDQGKTEEALSIFNQILRVDNTDAESLVSRAGIYALLQKRDSALQDLIRFFDLEKVPQFSFDLAVRLRLRLKVDPAYEIAESPAIPRLSASLVSRVIEELQREPRTLRTAVQLLRRWIDANGDSDDMRLLRSPYNLSLIGAGEFEEAMVAIRMNRSISDLNIQDTFNYAMARWGFSHIVPLELFESSVARYLERGSKDPNSFQCFSLANWLIGNQEQAKDLLEHALNYISKGPHSSFSCWSYLYRSPDLFKDDLNEMKRFYGGADIVPRVFSRHTESRT